MSYHPGSICSALRETYTFRPGSTEPRKGLVFREISGISRTFDAGSASTARNDRESPGKRGLLAGVTVLEHRECGRAGKWRGFFEAIWHPRMQSDEPSGLRRK